MRRQSAYRSTGPSMYRDERRGTIFTIRGCQRVKVETRVIGLWRPRFTESRKPAQADDGGAWCSGVAHMQCFQQPALILSS
jgi:hypothetical protein